MNIDINFNNEEIDTVKKDNKFKKIFIIIAICLSIIFLIIVYSRYKATSGLKVYEYKITDQALPDSFHGVKVVHFSDIYFGNTVDINYLKSIVSSINDLKPDIVLFTGDFTNKEIDDDTKFKIIDSLRSINSTIGKYAISGDIDNIDLFNNIMSSSGFLNLNDTSLNVYYKGETPILIGNQDIQSDLFSILLIHKPDDFDNLNNGFNLVLAGHSLNGQINIPLIKNLFLLDGSKKYYNHFYSVNDNDLYISSGIGTTDFKFRLFNKPSVNLYRLTKY